MLQALRDEQPVAGRIVQFSGGEPTIYPQFLESCAWPRRWASRTFRRPPTASSSPTWSSRQQCKEAGLHTLYLQFDGVCDDVYLRTRGEALLEKKLQVHRERPQGGHEDLLRADHRQGRQRSPDRRHHPAGDRQHRRGQRHQLPAGRLHRPHLARHELEAKRFTLSDFAHAVHQQTGICDPYEDWFPLSCVTPFSKLISALRGEVTTHLSCHPHCSLGTYLFVDQNKKATPVTRFVDVGAMLQDMDHAGAQGGHAAHQAVLEDQGLELAAQALPRGPRARGARPSTSSCRPSRG